MTSNGMTIVGGGIPDNSERDSRRCCRPGCRKQGAKRCVRHYCKPCCRKEPLADGERCPVSEHKGTTPPKVRPSSQPNRTADASEDVIGDDDEDDPLDVNVTFSRNLQREWQEVFAQAHGQKLTDFNYRNAGQNLVRIESHWTLMWFWEQV